MNPDELDALSTSFAATIREQQRQLETGMRTVASAFERAADRLAGLIGTSQSPVPAFAPVPAAAAAGFAGAVTIANTPLPVRVVNFPERSSGAGASGVAAAIGGGIGTFFGSLFGGIFAPIIGLADLVVAVTGGITIVAQLQALLRDFRAFTRELVTSLRGLITLLFSELTAAGFFPVSRLIASLLFLIDRGITLVLAHVQPIIVWLERVIERATDWLGDFVERAVSWLGRFITAATTFLAAYVTYLLDAIIRPAVDVLIRDAIRSAVSAFAGMLFAWVLMLGDVLMAALRYGATVIERALIQFYNSLPFVTPRPVPAAATAPDWNTLMRDAASRGRAAGQTLAELLLGPAPVRHTAGAGAGTAAGTGAPGTPPVFRSPGFRAPELRLPDMPAPAPQLERILTMPPATGEPARPAEPVTVNGGVTVQVNAETVSMDNAEATARVLAVHLVDELARLTQADRFSRGLPTGGVG